jgi:hypothetical protein
VPVPIEDAICRSHFILQGLLYGSNKEYNVFLVVPDMPAIRGWAARQPALASSAGTGVSAAGPEADAQLMATPEVRRLISDEVRICVGRTPLDSDILPKTSCFFADHERLRAVQAVRAPAQMGCHHGAVLSGAHSACKFDCFSYRVYDSCAL